MKSERAFIGAGLIVVSYPIALAVQFLLGTGAPTAVHFITGTGFLVFATSVFEVGRKDRIYPAVRPRHER